MILAIQNPKFLEFGIFLFPLHQKKTCLNEKRKEKRSHWIHFYYDVN